MDDCNNYTIYVSSSSIYLWRSRARFRARDWKMGQIRRRKADDDESIFFSLCFSNRPTDLGFKINQSAAEWLRCIKASQACCSFFSTFVYASCIGWIRRDCCVLQIFFLRFPPPLLRLRFSRATPSGSSSSLVLRQQPQDALVGKEEAEREREEKHLGRLSRILAAFHSSLCMLVGLFPDEKKNRV